MLGLSLTLRGPFDYADASDLAGGTSAEDSGPARAAWQAARLAMLVSVSAMTSAVFLGGYHGPWLPGPVWMLVKMAGRSEEHTSELQSLMRISYAVFCLKKKQKKTQ